jgi:hypothetical protein
MSSFNEDEPTAAAGGLQEPLGKGPRGGTTTLTKSGLVKKNFWLQRVDAEALRRKAHEERKTEAEIIREGLAKVLSP